MDEAAENIVVYRSKSNLSMSPIMRKKFGYQAIKTITIASGKIGIKHILGQILFENNASKFYNIRKSVLLEYIHDNGGHMKKSANLTDIIEKVKEVSDYKNLARNTLRFISIFQRRIKQWISNPELKLLGPGIPISRCVNEECPFTLENLKDLDPKNVITWKGEDSKIYGCDFMSLFVLLKNTLGGRNIYTDKYEELINLLNINLSNTGRSTRNNRRSVIFNEMKNPFTREKFQPELLVRLLQLANRRDLIKQKHKTTRSQQNIRARIRSRDEGLREPTDLVGTGRRNIIYTTDNSWQEQVAIASGITNIHLNDMSLQTMYTRLMDSITVEQTLADEIRRVGFYVPESMFSSVINPVREWVRILVNDAEINAPIPIVDVHIAGLIHSIRQFIIPFYSRISSYFSNPVFDGALNRSRITFSNIIHTNVIMNGIRNIMRGSGIIHSVDETHRSRMNDLAKHLTHLVLSSWVYCIRHLILEIFIRGKAIDISSGEHVISEGDRQTIAILFISALVNTGHLGSDFEWAM
jgi:hypothetical protein